MMEKEDEFAKDVRIHFRVTNYRKVRIKKRARDLGMDMSKYIMHLIKKDMNPKKEAEL